MLGRGDGVSPVQGSSPNRPWTGAEAAPGLLLGCCSALVNVKDVHDGAEGVVCHGSGRLKGQDRRGQNGSWVIHSPRQTLPKASLGPLEVFA